MPSPKFTADTEALRILARVFASLASSVTTIHQAAVELSSEVQPFGTDPRGRRAAEAFTGQMRPIVECVAQMGKALEAIPNALGAQGRFVDSAQQAVRDSIGTAEGQQHAMLPGAGEASSSAR